MYKCFKVLLVGALMVPMFSTINVSAASMPSSYNNMTSEEKQAFNKIYSSSSNSTLQKVGVKYSTELTGQGQVNNYHWTAWQKSARGEGINKKADTGKGVGSGNYKGFTKAKIDSWKTDQKYIDAIKKINNGKFPEYKDHLYPTDTSSSKATFWVDKVGFYDFMGDPRYSKITANGYRTFEWTEKVKKEKVVKESKTQKYTDRDNKHDTLNLGYNRLPGTVESLGEALSRKIKNITFKDNSKGYIDKETAKELENKLKNSMEWDTPSGKPSSGESNAKYQMNATVYESGGLKISVSISGQAGDGGTPRLALITLTQNKTKYTYETVSHTKKQQIASTVVARNAYASDIQKYKTFYLVPKSSVKSNAIAKRNNGFWMSINPYYHSEAKTNDEGGYSWTFSNQVTSGKANITLYYSLKQKWKYITDFRDNILSPDDLANPPLNPGENNGSGGNDNSNGNNSGDNNGGGDNSGGNKPGEGTGTNPGGNNKPGGLNPGESIIGDKDNQPMVSIDVDLGKPEGTETIRVPNMVHLVDIFGKR